MIEYTNNVKLMIFEKLMSRSVSENELLKFVKNQSMIDIKYTNNLHNT